MPMINISDELLETLPKLCDGMLINQELVHMLSKFVCQCMELQNNQPKLEWEDYDEYLFAKINTDLRFKILFNDGNPTATETWIVILINNSILEYREGIQLAVFYEREQAQQYCENYIFRGK